MEAMARAGRKRVRQEFTWEKLAQKYLTAYEALLATPLPRP
jgi:glycosyltransferase involved in cell wall biosynthesis